ncbi:MAG: AAA family ATPase [Rhodospirillales bacterium]|nr:AAA family ATPase [Rhodospirillales bacterium]
MQRRQPVPASFNGQEFDLRSWLKRHPAWSPVAALGGTGRIFRCECPNADAHSSDDVNGFRAMDATEHHPWRFECSHAHCQPLNDDRVNWLLLLIEQGRVTREDLESPELGGGPLDAAPAAEATAEAQAIEDGDGWSDPETEVSGSEIGQRQIPPPVFLLGDREQPLIPEHDVTFLAGAGGTGKSRLVDDLAISVALGEPFLGLPTRAAEVLIVNFDDDLNSMQRRLMKAAAGRRTAGITLKSGFGLDGTLKAPAKARDQAATPFAQWLAARLTTMGAGPKLVVLDHLAALYAGDYKETPEVVRFLTALRSICRTHNATLLVIAHPSDTATKNGELTFGASAWRNNVRSFLTFDFERDSKGEILSDTRILGKKKNNNAAADRKGEGLRVTWSDGRFVLEQPTSAADASTPRAEVKAPGGGRSKFNPSGPSEETLRFYVAAVKDVLSTHIGGELPNRRVAEMVLLQADMGRSGEVLDETGNLSVRTVERRLEAVRTDRRSRDELKPYWCPRKSVWRGRPAPAANHNAPSTSRRTRVG